MPMYVQIIKRDTKKCIKQIECGSARLAAQVQGGVEINLNHKDYRTAIEAEVSSDCEVSK